MNNKIDQQKKHFENISKYYYISRQGKNHLEFKKHIWKYFFDKVKYHFKEEIYTCLEPMCGYGEGFKILINYGKLNILYKGFDYSEEIVKIAQKFYPNLNITLGNILDYQDESIYDLIILIGGLHHVYEEANRVVKNISKLHKKGGYFINLEPTNNNYLIKLIRDYIYKKNKIFDHETERAFNLRELDDIFQSNGYGKVVQMFPGLLGYVLYYNPDAFPLLNIGNERIVKLIFNLEKRFYFNFIGRFFSFATLTMWRKL